MAAALFYISLAKVVLVQYGNLRSGLISVKTSVDSVDALRRKVFQAVGAFIVNFGYLPRLFKFSAREVDEDEDIGGRKTVVVDPPEVLADNDSSESKHDDGAAGEGDSPESQGDEIPDNKGDDNKIKEEADDNDNNDEEPEMEKQESESEDTEVSCEIGIYIYIYILSTTTIIKYLSQNIDIH